MAARCSPEGEAGVQYVSAAGGQGRQGVAGGKPAGAQARQGAEGQNVSAAGEQRVRTSAPQGNSGGRGSPEGSQLVLRRGREQSEGQNVSARPISGGSGQGQARHGVALTAGAAGHLAAGGPEFPSDGATDRTHAHHDVPAGHVSAN